MLTVKAPSTVVCLSLAAIALALFPQAAGAANPARHLLTRADLRGLHFGLTYGGTSRRAGCRVAARYREAPHLDSDALTNEVAFCASAAAAQAFYESPFTTFHRCRPLSLTRIDQASACSAGTERLVVMRRGRRVAELTTDSPSVGGLKPRKLRQLTRVQARRL